MNVVFKANNRRYMFLVSSNAYRDREGDIVKTKALEQYVKNFRPTPHKYWHGGEPIGEIIGAKMVGPFLLELSQELPNEVIDLQRFADDEPMLINRAEIWDAIESSDTAWGASIGFGHKQGDETDHEFEEILKVETSSLPLDKAANGITPSFVLGGQPMSETAKQDRRNWFEKLLGKDAGGELEAAMEGVRTALDKTGLERKEFDATKMKGLIEDMRARIMDMGRELTDDETKLDAFANMAIAELMGTATEIVEDLPMEEMQEEEEDEPMPMAVMELTQQVKALATEANDVQTEMKELIPAFIEMAGIVKELAPLAEKAKGFDDLGDRLAKVEKLVALTPRAASTAKETRVSESEDTLKIKRELEKSQHGQKLVLGVPVKE
jgi:hypothetical protein